MRRGVLLGGLLLAGIAAPARAEWACASTCSGVKETCIKFGQSSDQCTMATGACDKCEAANPLPPSNKKPPAVDCSGPKPPASCKKVPATPPRGPAPNPTGTPDPRAGPRPGPVGGATPGPVGGGGAGGGGGGGEGGGGDAAVPADGEAAGGPGASAADKAAAESLRGSVFGSDPAGKSMMDRADRLGSAMKATMTSAEDGLAGPAGKALGGGGGGRAAPPPGKAAEDASARLGPDGKAIPQGLNASARDLAPRPPPGAEGPGFANPTSAQDFALASMSGFGGAFSAAGLKMGKGPDGSPAVLRSDGTPASQDEIRSLSERISKDPLALMTRPDFFDVIKREDFNALKKDYLTKPQLADDAFRHVEMTPAQRDFKRSQSCDRLSGNCNRQSRSMSYRKGDYVPPEDLNAIWDKIKAEAEAPDPGRAGATAMAPSSKSAVGGIGAQLANKFKSIFGGMGSLFGGDSVGAVAGTPIPASRQGGTDQAAEYGTQAGWGGSGGQPRQPIDLNAPRRDTLPIFSPPPAEAASPPGPDRRAEMIKRYLIAFLAAASAGGFVFLIFALKRRKKKEAEETPVEETVPPSEQ